jgi:C-terminal processing protease CtpA/Prc
LIEEMIPHIPGHGTIRTGRTRTLEDNFPVLYRDLIAQPQHYGVELVEPSGSVRLVRVDPVTPTGSDKIGQARYPELSGPRPPALALESRSSPNVAILTIRSFGGGTKDSSGNDYNTFLERSFRKIEEKNNSDLIVDLRGNGGGSDVYGARLFSYLTDRPFKYYDHLGVVVDQVDFLEHTSLSQDFNEEIKKRIRVDDLGRRTAVGHPNLQTQEPLKPGFGGRVFFLIDRGSFSATAEFAAVARHHERGTFIGEETAGGFHGNTSGMTYLLTLPHTKLRINIPMIKYVSAVSSQTHIARGIIPDYRVLPKIEDLLTGHDPVMEFALKQIQLLQGR